VYDARWQRPADLEHCLVTEQFASHEPRLAGHSCATLQLKPLTQ